MVYSFESTLHRLVLMLLIFVSIISIDIFNATTASDLVTLRLTFDPGDSVFITCHVINPFSKFDFEPHDCSTRVMKALV